MDKKIQSFRVEITSFIKHCIYIGLITGFILSWAVFIIGGSFNITTIIIVVVVLEMIIIPVFFLVMLSDAFEFKVSVYNDGISSRNPFYNPYSNFY